MLEEIKKGSEEILVSVCCAVYNQVNFIRDTLDGFVMQKTNFRFEVLVNDDCSTDGTTDIIREYENKFPELIKPVYHNENQYSKGISVNYVNNFSRVKGKYIALCEGDDYWIASDKLQLQADYLESNLDCAITYTDYKSYDQTEEKFYDNLYDRDNFLHPSFRLHLIHTMYLAPCTWMFRTEALPQIPDGCVDGTYCMMLEFLAKHKVAYLDKVTAVYRVQHESACHSDALDKRYNFLQGVIKLQDYYMQKFDSKPELVKEVHYHMYNRTYKLAQAQGDFAFIKVMRDFWKKNPCRNFSDRVYYFCSGMPHLLNPMFFAAYQLKRSVKYLLKKR